MSLLCGATYILMDLGLNCLCFHVSSPCSTLLASPLFSSPPLFASLLSYSLLASTLFPSLLLSSPLHSSPPFLSTPPSPLLSPLSSLLSSTSSSPSFSHLLLLHNLLLPLLHHLLQHRWQRGLNDVEAQCRIVSLGALGMLGLVTAALSISLSPFFLSVTQWCWRLLSADCLGLESLSKCHHNYPSALTAFFGFEHHSDKA